MILDRNGNFSATNHQEAVDTNKLEETIKIIGEHDDTGAPGPAITSASCAGGPIVIVALPGGVIACQLADAAGASVNAHYLFDATGSAVAPEKFA